MTKGDFMKLVYTKDELSNINPGLPTEYYDGKDLSIQVDTWCHVMNFNENTLFGKLENMFEVADERGIEIPLPISPEEMAVIVNIQALTKVIKGTSLALWQFRHLTLDQLRAEQERLIPFYNNAIKQKQILKDIDQEKLQRLMELEDLTEESVSEMFLYSIVPAICCTPGCDSTYQMEPDQYMGHCEECGFNNVKSAPHLMGVI